jgi:outer membrane lipoprotein LolB
MHCSNRLRMGAWLAAGTAALWLQACAQSAPPRSAIPSTPAALPITTPSSAAAHTGRWDGRLSLKLGPWGEQAASGITLAFDLDLQATQGVLNLSTAMGTQVARLTWHTATHGLASATLETAEGRQEFATVDAMTRQVLGEGLPLSAIAWWLRGLPEPMVAAQTGAHPRQFSQHGWLVDASALDEGRLDASRPASPDQRSVTLRLRLDL